VALAGATPDAETMTPQLVRSCGRKSNTALVDHLVLAEGVLLGETR
jgi:hypothetical protein